MHDAETLLKRRFVTPRAPPSSPIDFELALGKDVLTTVNRVLQRNLLSPPVAERDFHKNPITPAERRERAWLYSAQLRTKRKFMIDP